MVGEARIPPTTQRGKLHLLLIYSVVAGVLLGIFYALLSMGLNLIFGVQKIINLAHGDMVMIGGIFTWELYSTFHVSPILSAVIAIPFMVLIGIILYYALIPRIKSSREFETLSLVLFFGVSQVIQSLATMGFGNNQRTLPINSIPSRPIHFLGQMYQASWWVAAGVAIPLLIGFFIYLYGTTLGRQTRAVMADANEAATVGIDAQRVSALTFGIGLALAAASGAMAIFILGGVSPSEGSSITVIAFAITVFGSLGNPFGTLVGGILFGVTNQLAQVYATSWSNLIPYVLVLGVMLIRPQGLLGKGARIV